MGSVLEHARKILGAAALQATATAGRGGDGDGNEAAADSNSGSDNASRGDVYAGYTLAAGFTGNGAPSRAEQASNWTGAAALGAGGHAANGESRGGVPRRPSPGLVKDSWPGHPPPGADGAGPAACASPREPHHARLLHQPAQAWSPVPQPAPAPQGPTALPSLGAVQSVQSRLPGGVLGQGGASPLAQAGAHQHSTGLMQPAKEMHRREEATAASAAAAAAAAAAVAAAGAARPLHLDRGGSAGTACSLLAAAEQHAAATSAQLEPGPAAAERAPASEQRRVAPVMGQASHFATPNAVAQRAAAGTGQRLPYTPPAPNPPALGHAAAAAGGSGRHGDVAPVERGAPPALPRPPAGGVSAAPFGVGGAGFAAFGSHPLCAVGSAAIATPNAQLVSQPRSQAGTGWALPSNGLPAAGGGTGCGRQLPGSVVSIRRGTPSVNNAYLDFHSLLEQPMCCAAVRRPTGHSDALGRGGGDGGGGVAVCEEPGWLEEFREVAWLRRLAMLPGPTEQEREALEFELSIVGMFLGELRSMIGELEAESDGGVVAVTAGGGVLAVAGLEAACAPSLHHLGGGDGVGPAGGGDVSGGREAQCGGSVGGVPQQSSAAGAEHIGAMEGDGAAGFQRRGQGAAHAPLPEDGRINQPAAASPQPLPSQQQGRQQQQQQVEFPEWQRGVQGAGHAPAVAVPERLHEAPADLVAVDVEEMNARHGSAAMGPSGHGGACNLGAVGPQDKGDRPQPASGDGESGSREIEGWRAKQSTAQGTPPPSCNLALRRAPGGAASAGSDEDNVGRGPRCKRARTEAAGGARAAAEPAGAVRAAPAAAAAGGLRTTSPEPGALAAAAQPVTGVVEHSHGGRRTGAAAGCGDGGDGTAAVGCPTSEAGRGIVTARLQGAPHAASTLAAPESPLAHRAPSPVPCPQQQQQEPEHQAGGQANARRRHEKAPANKRHRSEPLPQPQPLEPLSLNPLAPPPQQQMQMQKQPLPQQLTNLPAGGQRQARRAKARERGSAAAAAAAAAAPMPGVELAAPGPAGRRAKPLYLLSTTLSPEERARLKELTRRVRGLELLGDVQQQLTHLVVSLNSEGQVMGRTIKYLRAVIQGCWVVGMAWVDACLAAGRLLPEGPFEATGDTVHPGTPAITRLRPERGDPPLFSGLRFCVMYLKGTFDGGITKPELEALLQAAGGTLVRRPANRAAAAGGGNAAPAAAPVTAAAALFGAAAASDLYDTTGLCTQQQQMASQQQQQEERGAGGSPLPAGMPPVFVLVTPEVNVDAARIVREWGCAPIKTSWVYDCISHYTLLPPEAFRSGHEPYSSATDTS
ncbi:hypothetical protein PLESTF_000551600 [Pleodorina starrii]|nr:hypothetical protein PLESTF_000551600 [Pleodorina starrii]